MTLDSFDRRVTHSSKRFVCPTSRKVISPKSGSTYARTCPSFASSSVSTAASTHCILWQRCLYRCASKAATFTLLQDTLYRVGGRRRSLLTCASKQYALPYEQEGRRPLGSPADRGCVGLCRSSSAQRGRWWSIICRCQHRRQD